MSAGAKKNIFSEADWAFFIYLTGITHVKLYVKLAALVFYIVYVVYNKYAAGKLQGFSKFYFLMPLLGTISAFVNGSFQADAYWFSYVNSVLGWLLAGVGSYLLFITIINIPRSKLIASVKLFFLLNALVSFGELAVMMVQSGQLVPYWYWEPTEYFGGSTGDHVKGILNNISITNAMVNAVGVVFFVYINEIKWASLCVLILLLCTSNVTLILLIALLALMILLVRSGIIRKNILIALLIIGLVYPFLSLNNIKYVARVYDVELEKKEEAKKEQFEAQQKQKINVSGRIIDYLNFNNSANKALYQSEAYKYRLPLNDTILLSYKDELKYIGAFGSVESRSNSNVHMEPDSLKRLITRWYGLPYERTPLSKDAGLVKIFTMKQTLYYLAQSKKHLIFGAGMGNFSSKQAIKSTGLGLQGSYPPKYIYVNPDFLRYHLYSLLYVFSMPISEHSVINMPDTVYNQIGGEYGILGIAAFVLFYVGYMIRNFKKMHVGRYIAFMAMLFFGFEYWFEMLSLTIFVELIIMLDIFGFEDGRTA